jgi:hypothetical protein
LGRNCRPPPFRDLVRDFLPGFGFERAVLRRTVFRTGRSLLAAFPARAPTTPPTTAPTGPAILPIAAPVTAPAVCFGTGGNWISSDGRGLFFFSGFELSGINVNSCISSINYKDTSDDKADVALVKLKCPGTLTNSRHWFRVETLSDVLEVQWTTGRRYRISEEGRFLLEMPRKANFLKQAEQFEDDYNDNNYSNYVEDVSVHAVTNIRLGCGD